MLPHCPQKPTSSAHGSFNTNIPVNGVGAMRHITTGTVCPIEYPFQMRQASRENWSSPETGASVQTPHLVGTVWLNMITRIARPGPDILSRVSSRRASSVSGEMLKSGGSGSLTVPTMALVWCIFLGIFKLDWSVKKRPGCGTALRACKCGMCWAQT
jgi:hypothetical protein